MTRINVVPPSELTRQHLIAEYRELPRIPNLVRYHQIQGRVPADFIIPADYTLGYGHMKFFYDKCEYLRIRYQELVREMRSRGYNTTIYPNNLFQGLDRHWMNDYTPTTSAMEINRARIQERLNGTQDRTPRSFERSP